METKEQMNFLLNTIGLRGAPVVQHEIEYIAANGVYTLTKVSASYLSEVIKAVTDIHARHHTTPVGRMNIRPFKLHEKRQLALFSAERLD